MFAKLNVCLMLIGIGLFSLIACQSQEQIGIQAEMNGVPYRVVSVQELQTMLENKDFTMINVHTPWEGDIPQTDLRLSYDQIEQNLNQLPAEKDAKIVVYCLTSGMAKKAVATLLSQGYTNIWMLEGGTTAWLEAGLTIDKE
ncbi:MAG: rhodanese-like domain-containing protein [Anaerolineaceae bacterium]|jgi:rhodanese-related sulfurtransferase|nr:MAG: rhodanese-like domain-containing protein [Anaerolineaceae bacterium]